MESVRSAAIPSRAPSTSRVRGPAWSVLTFVALLAGSLAACASPGSMTSSNSRVITQEEVNALSVSTAYEVVERLRPLWLRAPVQRSFNTTTEVVVVQDGVYFGGVDSLRQIPAGGVRELRYLSGSEATNAIPGLASGRHVDAAIMVFQGTPN